MFESVEKSRPNVIKLDSGNLFGVRSEVERKQTEFLCEHTGALGYSVIGLGEWDLNYGLAFLRDMEKKHGLKFVNANLRRGADKKLVFPPYVVYERGGLRVAEIAVLSPRYKIVTMTSEPDDYVADSPRDALDRFLPELKQKADLVILHAQMPSAEVRQLLLDMGPGTGIDVCIEGHDPKQYRRPSWVGDVLLLAANNQGKYVGQADLLVSRKGVIDQESAKVTIHALDENAPEVESLRKKVEAFEKGNQETASVLEPFGHDRPLGSASEKFLGVHTCARCHSDAARSYAQSKHAQAFQSLVTKGQDQNGECVACHVVGFDHVNGYDRVPDPKVQGRDALKNVQCEACHGYGTQHDRQGDWAAQARKSCVRCHDAENSPDFDYASYWARIAH